MIRMSVKKDLAFNIALAIAALATVVYLGSNIADFLAKRDSVRYSDLEAMRSVKTFKDLEAKAAEANGRTAALIAELYDLSKAPPPNSSLLARQLTLIRHDVDTMNARIADLNSSVQLLNKSIESSPEKALTLPLLRKDLDDFKASSQHDADSLRAEMLRGYELNKWLIGLLLAAIVGIVIKGALESRTAPRTYRSGFE